jgi:hypothetical protein
MDFNTMISTICCLALILLLPLAAHFLPYIVQKVKKFTFLQVFINPKKRILCIIISYIISIVCLGVASWGYLNVPKGYTIGFDSLIIHQRYGQIKIPFENISNVWRDKERLYGISWYTMRIRSNGIVGIFGSAGKFCKKQVGWFEIYATDMNKLIVLEGEKKYVISPDDPDRFISLLKQRLSKKAKDP